MWPVPESYSRKIPYEQDAGFKAKRYYKYGKGKHAGIDIYAPMGSKVLAIEDGKIVHISQFTGAPYSPELRKTYYVMIEHEDGKVGVYGEIKKPKLKKGQLIKAGQLVGYVEKVFYGREKIGSSMLHFELYKKGKRMSSDWYNEKPNGLINPTKYLKKIRSK